MNYALTPAEIAIETALIRGALRVHPKFSDEQAFVKLLTPNQQWIYLRYLRGMVNA